MRKTVYIVLGLVAGTIAGVGALIASFHGSNLFHGGHPNAIAVALLPGIGIVDHLSGRVPPAIPVVIFIASLLQFPVYGVLAGHDLAKKAISKLTLGVIALHVCGSAVASYGLALDYRWRAESEKYGDCIRSHFAPDDISYNSAEIVRLVKWIDQSEKQLKALQEQKKNGAVFTPDPEPTITLQLQHQHEELAHRWKIYKDAGGPANTPREVTPIPPPCGNPPARPVFF